MLAMLRPLRAAAFVVVALLMVAPSAARAEPRGYGTLIEYAGDVNKDMKFIRNMFISFFGSGL